MRNANIAPAVNPYNWQEHIYSKNQPENIGFLESFRAVMEEYPAITCVGEVGDAQYGLDILGEYTRGNDRVHMCYAFEFLASEPLSSHRVAEVFHALERVAAEGWACWAFSNHDVMRHASRWNLNDAAKRMHTTLQMCLRGSICIYQGEELGLPEGEVAYEDLQDPYGIQFWPEFKGRDGCRTPIVWESDAPQGGFSTVRPWLPVDPAHRPYAVDRQEDDADALLHHYRRAIAFRAAHPVLTKGDQIDMRATNNVLHFTRQDKDQTMFCAFNFGDVPAEIVLDPGKWAPVGDTLNSAAPDPDGVVHLDPWQCCLAVRTE
jgi:alpha-glucosidase